MTAPGRQGSALVIGEALVDVVIHPGQEPVDIPGGSPANVALGLARLGRDAELHCWIGTDERGKAVRAHLEASGVRLEVPADPSVVVADTVGAGDSFMGGLEDALWSEDLVGAERREALRAMDAETLERIVRHAAAIADITVSRAGANPPTRDELP